MRIPFVDLKAQYASIKAEVDETIRSVVEQTCFIGGQAVQDFERDFAAFCRVRHAIGVGNGTDALLLALKAAGVGPGDEVITVANSFIATAAAIVHAGATPVLADIDPATATIDPEQIERAITPRTRAVIPVHLYGMPADMDPILDIARRRSLAVIEDASQAHGADYRGRRVGSLGDIACFSFYPGKNLGCYGDGGCVTTNDDALASRLRALHDHGRTSKYEHAVVGFNSRLDTLQAAVLQIKLRRLEDWSARRRQVASWYEEDLHGSRIEVPQALADRTHVFHLYPVQLDDREALRSRLEQAGVGCGIHYPIPLHLQPALASLGYRRGDMPHTERAADRMLSLPMYAELTRDQVGAIAAIAREGSRGLH